METTLIFPHHLFESHPGLKKGRLVCLIEDPLFFHDEQYLACFHLQKLVFHRASMKHFQRQLQERGYSTVYLEAKSGCSLKEHLMKCVPSKIHVVEFDDDALEQRTKQMLKDLQISLEVHPSPGFISSLSDFSNIFSEKKHFSCQLFYINQRKQFDLLLDEKQRPLGGKWSYDTENRKKPPKTMKFPFSYRVPSCSEVASAKRYVQEKYSDHPGSCNHFNYAVTHLEAKRCLRDFLENRFAFFGDYEDAILQKERILFHSVLSPYLNAGLITPKQLLEEALDYADNHEIPLNSLEGFVRQVIGWREFIRGVYHTIGTQQRKSNFFSHKKKIPLSFYKGTTGILPVDVCIQKLQDHAYAHHIERLMVLGNFLLLCEIDPHEIYRWFMEMFIDSYDWVMVPNIYGMSQYADGGLMTTKPYLSGSNYILKMSDYPKGEWTEVWDALFWRFFIKHLSFFERQPRLNMLCSLAKQKKREDTTVKKAEQFLEGLS